MLGIQTLRSENFRSAADRLSVIGRAMGCALFALACCFPLTAQEVEPRRVFVPVEDLDAVISRDQRGVLLPKEEFQKLYRDAQKNSPIKSAAPINTLISGANYSARFDGEQLVVEATIKLSQLVDSWKAWPLNLSGMAVESAKLNGQPARLGRNEQTLYVLTETRGEHTLTLEVSTPLSAVGADKVASIGVMPLIPGTLKIAVPAGKHLQLDGLSVVRPAPNDQPATYELAVGGKRSAVAIQLSDRQRERATDSLLFATTGFGLRVAPGEVTLHAVTSLQVHGTPLDRLVCVVPKTLEITDVDSNGLEAWELSDHPDDASSTQITLNYRQPFDGARRIDFRGVMAVPAGESWRVPTLKINKVTSHIGRALVQHAPTVRLRTVESVGVRTAAVSEVDLKNLGTSGATDAGQVALLFDVWREEFSLGFVAQPKEQDVQASISSIFDLTATGLDLITAATVETSFAPLFELEVSLPAEWLLTSVSVNGQPLPWHVRKREDEPGINHVRVPLPQPLQPGQMAKLEVRAHRDPDGWPVEEAPVEVALPELRLPQSSVTEGTYVIKADADLDVVPGDMNGLDPANVPVAGTRLGFAYQDTRFGGTLKIERKPSRVSVRTLTFARLDKQTLHTHFDADLEILGGGLRAIEVALPESAGKDLRFQMLNAPARIVEQTSRAGENGELIWALRLNRHLVGTGTIVVSSVVARAGEREIERGREGEKDKAVSPLSPSPPLSHSPSLPLPFLRVSQADRQNGFIAVEAEGDQRLTITAQDSNKATLPDVDPIDLPGPLDYAPSQRIVAAFRYFTGSPTVTVTDERFDRLPVPTAICRIAKITSTLSTAGEFQHQAQFQFTAVGVQSLRVRFEGASKDTLTPSPSSLAPLLWSALVDGRPVEVRRTDEAFLIPLPASGNPTTERTLQLFYRTQVPALRGSGRLSQPPPELTVLNGAGVSQPMQVLDQQWELHHPADLLLTDSQGAFVPDVTTPLDQTNWLTNLPKSLSLPNRWKLGRIVFTLVIVLGVVAVIWSRFRWGWQWGVFAPAVVLGIGFFLWNNVAPSVQSARSGASPPNAASEVSGGSAITWFDVDAEVDASRFVTVEAQPGGSIALGRSATSMDDAPRREAPPPAVVESAAPAAATPAPAKKPADKRRPLFADEESKSKAGDRKPTALGLQFNQPVPNSDGKPAVADPSEQSKQRSDKALPSMITKMPESKNETLFEEMSPFAGVAFRQGAFDGRLSSANDSGERGGLLSLTMAMESQAGATTKKFRYLGTDTAGQGIGLNVVFENQAAGWAGRWLWIAALAFVAWVLPQRLHRLRALWIALGLMAPLALAAIVPLAWQNALDGIFFGTLAAIMLWTLRFMGDSLVSNWPRMKTKTFWTRLLTRRTAALCLLALLVANSAFAQEPQVARPTIAQPVNPNPDVPARPTIIIPYDNPKDPLAAERVYLPHAKFIELWNAAHPESRVVPAAPMDGFVAEALVVVAPNKQTNGADATAKVTARITLFSFRKVQIVLPIPLRLAALSDAKLNGETAAIVVREENGTSRLHVVINKPGLHVLDLSAEVPVNQQGPAGQLVIGVDPLPSGKLLFVPPTDEVTFRVNGASNLYRLRSGAVGGEGEKKNHFEVPISAGGDIRLAWQPKQAAGAVDAIVQADSSMAVGVEDAGVRIASGWQFKVPRGSINDLSFSLPKELKVRSISGPDVGGWELGENVDGRVLRVFLRRAVADQTTLAFELFLETLVGDEPVAIQVPTFAPLAVSRDFGTVGLFAQPYLALKNIATKGLTQINANQFAGVNLSEGGAASPPLSAFRYTTRPFEIGFEAQRKVPDSTGFAEHALVVERRKVRMSSRMRWDLAGALRSSVSVLLPPGWLPIDVDATALQDWHLDAATNVLTVEFTEPRIGAVEVILQGNVPKEPDDSIAEIAVPVPQELSKLTTQAAVWFDPAYQPTVNSSNGWKPSVPEHCSEELCKKLSRPAKFIFTSSAIAPEALGFDLPRAVPKLSADAVTLITVSDTALDYSLAMQWKITEAAADTFTFTTPDWLAGKLDFQGVGIRQTSFASAGDGSGRTRWSVTLQDPVGSRYFLLATATLPPPTKREVAAPTIQFEGKAAVEGDAADQAAAIAPLETQRQYVVAINISSNQLATAGDVGEPVQRDELPIVVDQRLVDQATAVLRVRQIDKAPTWTLKSFAIQAGTPASVNLADLTTVLAADGTWRMQAVYTIKNRSRQFLALQLPPNSQALSVFVADQPSRLVELKKEGKSYQLIALPKTSEADLSFRVKLVLAGRLSTGALPRGLKLWSNEIELPTPNVISPSDDKEFGIPVARTLWSVHVPKEWSAKPLNNPVKNNLTEQSDDTSSLAYQTTLLQEANELMRVVEGSNYRSSQRMQARNNLKQLGLALHSYQGQASSRIYSQSEEGRKLALSLQDFDFKCANLESRVVTDGATNFNVAKDQQQAEKARAAQTKVGQNTNVDFFFDQLVTNDEGQQRMIVTDNNTNLLLGNGGAFINGEDRNGNGMLDAGEDANNDGVLNLGEVQDLVLGARVSGTSPDTGLKFKLNVPSDSQPVSRKSAEGFGGKGSGGRQSFAGKGVTEVDRLNRRKQATDQLNELNKTVDGEKQQQQQAQIANLQPQSRTSSVSNLNAPAQPTAGGLGGFDTKAIGSGPGVNQPGNDFSDLSTRRTRFKNVPGGSPLSGGGGGGGFGGGMGGGAIPQTSYGRGVISSSGVAGVVVMSDGLSNFDTTANLAESNDGPVVAGWTQSGGLSLPLDIQHDGNVLRFSRASGSPRLSLAIRPLESDNLGLGFIWSAVWAAMAIWLLRMIVNSAKGCSWKHAATGLSSLGLLAMFFLPSPFSELGFLVFAATAVALAIGVLRPSRQNA